ncbi:MAG: hypothetical protein GKR99_02895 [Rhodobacteraceae bacterium]|nr:hypothetical protein [Paracoccaceae bacterium]
MERKIIVQALKRSFSTQSAYSALTNPEFAHGLSIRGFDFPMENYSGFSGRQKRMQKVADHFSLELQELRTDLSLSYKTQYDSFNVLFLTTCLGFAGYGMGGGAFSGDFSAAGQLVATTFCSAEGISKYLSTSEFQVEMLGSLPSRGEKIKTIYENAPDLIGHLGFCLVEQEHGGNCGVCDKCIRTRLAMEYMGLDHSLIFEDELDPIEYFRQRNPGSAYMANLVLLHIDLTIDGQIDDAKRREYMKIADDMRRKWHGLRGNYIA